MNYITYCQTAMIFIAVMFTAHFCSSAFIREMLADPAIQPEVKAFWAKQPLGGIPLAGTWIAIFLTIIFGALDYANAYNAMSAISLTACSVLLILTHLKDTGITPKNSVLSRKMRRSLGVIALFSYVLSFFI